MFLLKIALLLKNVHKKTFVWTEIEAKSKLKAKLTETFFRFALKRDENVDAKWWCCEAKRKFWCEMMRKDAKKSITKWCDNRAKWILFRFQKRNNEKIKDAKRAHPRFNLCIYEHVYHYGYYQQWEQLLGLCIRLPLSLFSDLVTAFFEFAYLMVYPALSRFIYRVGSL